MPGSPPDPGRTETALGAGLAAVAGAVDVLTFTRLGQAFASIATGNIVVIGISIGQADLAMFRHVAVAVACYCVGVLLGGVVIRSARGSTACWPVQVTVLCAAELVVLLVLVVVWWGDAGAPRGGAQYLALVCAAGAMGLQSAAFRMVHVPGVTTTYFTGTLTSVLAGLVTTGRLNGAAVLALVAFLGGAAVSGLLVARASTAAVLLPAGLLTLVVASCIVGRRRLSRERPT